MNGQADIDTARRAYAKAIVDEAGVKNERLEAAFASVPREDYLGPGPWLIVDWIDGYKRTPDADPAHLYTDNVVAIDPNRHLNNGQPSGHAAWIGSAAPEPGERIVHIGTGTGYYTAILAHLVGPTGQVVGVEIDPALAARATANLAALPNVAIVAGDGAGASFPPADVIYVNAGVTRPADAWLDGLAEGGRLVLPLTTERGFMNAEGLPMERRGAIFCMKRRGAGYLARWVSPAAFIPCASTRDDESEVALARAFAHGGWERVTRLYRDADIPDERCWLKTPGWCLAYS